MIKNKIKKIRNLFHIYKVDGYIIPKNDEFFSEYAFPNRLKAISNFTGSAGFCLILENKNFLFVDGRYILQAKIESGKNFKIFEIPKLFPSNILLNFKKKLKIGFDPKLFTYSTIKRYFDETCELVSIKQNLVDEVSKYKILRKSLPFYNLDHKVTGERINSKVNRLIKNLKKNKIDNIFISAPENVAWLLNLRGSDNPHSPIPNCKIILTKNKKIIFFSDFHKMKKIKKTIKYKNIVFYDYKFFFQKIENLKGKNFCIDRLSCSIFYESLIGSKFKIVSFQDPCYILKAIKNSTEIKNMQNAHIADGVALTKFLFWIKNNKNNKLDEIKIEKKLESFRKKNKNYLYPSFNSIIGSGPNGSIIHYRATKKTNRKIKNKDILLFDSGGQYKYGTTDVTRTICFDNPGSKIKDLFTRVLKGHISVATTDLNKINTGYEIDKKARFWLNKVGLDYGHGTGHGVGFFLNVHEGPQSISKFNFVKIKKGMILSNEPGYYKDNKFGIRIENLVFAQEEKNKLFFKNLTMAPIDIDLIDFKILNLKEKNYLFKYHLEIYSKIYKYLNKKERKWLQNLI